MTIRFTYIGIIVGVGTALLLLNKFINSEQPHAVQIDSMHVLNPPHNANNFPATHPEVSAPPLNHKELAPPIIGVTEQSIDQYRATFFAEKESKITTNAQGHYQVDISSANSATQAHIESDGPIYFPSETDMNLGVKGCVLGGYYVELNHVLRLRLRENDSESVYVYRCDFIASSNSYTLSTINSETATH